MSGSTITTPMVVNGIEFPKCCSGCEYYLPSFGAEPGICRRSPPQVVVIYHTDANGVSSEEGRSIWPPMNANGVCGEWTLRVQEFEQVATSTVFVDPRGGTIVPPTGEFKTDQVSE